MLGLPLGRKGQKTLVSIRESCVFRQKVSLVCPCHRLPFVPGLQTCLLPTIMHAHSVNLIYACTRCTSHPVTLMRTDHVRQTYAISTESTGEGWTQRMQGSVRRGCDLLSTESNSSARDSVGQRQSECVLGALQQTPSSTTQHSTECRRSNPVSGNENTADLLDCNSLSMSSKKGPCLFRPP